MTLRGGGRPRLRDQAHPLDAEDIGRPSDPVVAPSAGPPTNGWNGRGRPIRNGSTGSRFGLIRFLVFVVVLAALVLTALLTVLRPLFADAVISWAADNPSALSVPFVADMVRSDLGDKLTQAPSDDPLQRDFVVADGDTAGAIASKLASEGYLRDPRAFVFLVTEQKLSSQLKAGTFLLRRNMTPQQLVEGLLNAPVTTVVVQLREGLRLEQVTTKLETLPLEMNVADFYKEATSPPQALLSDYPWLKLPQGASLEGFLAPATYTVAPDVTPDALIRMMLDAFYRQIGPDRMTVPKARGMTFYQVLTLASLVEKEAVIDAERPLIAGVYQNRLNHKMLLNADPSVYYGHDTIELKKLALEQWTNYSFWSPLGTRLDGVQFPPELAGYQTYVNRGLMPGPICTPTAASIDAALQPDTKTGYLYFVAKNDGSHEHAFARTLAEHEANLTKYGYR
ncbi:MAG: endolytic transglycosylase MltG [Chloroflexi bacterium]|nr:MAG: endolytic transglycosylase MltG [Chloroflexota bacterium]